MFLCLSSNFNVLNGFHLCPLFFSLKNDGVSLVDSLFKYLYRILIKVNKHLYRRNYQYMKKLWVRRACKRTDVSSFPKLSQRNSVMILG